MKEVRGDLKTLLQDAAEIKGRLSGLDGRLGALPTSLQIATLTLGMLAVTFGGIFAVIKFALPGAHP